MAEAKVIEWVLEKGRDAGANGGGGLWVSRAEDGKIARPQDGRAPPLGLGYALTGSLSADLRTVWAS
jgi:hypothetical protein